MIVHSNLICSIMHFHRKPAVQNHLTHHGFADFTAADTADPTTPFSPAKKFVSPVVSWDDFKDSVKELVRELRLNLFTLIAAQPVNKTIAKAARKMAANISKVRLVFILQFNHAHID